MKNDFYWSSFVNNFCEQFSHKGVGATKSEEKLSLQTAQRE